MKKLLSTILALALFSALLTACTPKGPSSSAEPVKIKVGASPAPHAAILELVKEDLAAQNIELEIVEFTDYVLPNLALEQGEIDANFFQHLPYLQKFNSENDTHIVSVATVHFEPLGIYAGKTKTLEAIANGAKIAVPNDTANEARALQLLEKLGIIKLAQGKGLTATPLDIVENPHNVKITELEAAQLPNALPDVDFAIINGNYVIGAGITDAPLATEDKDSDGAQTYANILCVREGDEQRAEILALKAALNSEKVRTYIVETYGTLAVPVF